MHIKSLDTNTLASGPSIKSILEAETSTRITPQHRKSFRRADLEDLDLAGVKICASNDASSTRRSNFMGASFARSNLKNAQFSGLDLRAADFSDCDLRGAYFVMCDLDGACFDRVAMHEHTEDKTGYYPSIVECTIRHMKATGADFTGAMFALPDPGDDQHFPANMARFEDCEFDRVNFSGDWTNALFLCCDLSNSSPGSYVGRGARWDVSICCRSCISGMLTKNCDREYHILPKDFVEVPDEAWDENGFEVEEGDDGFEVLAAAKANHRYKEAYAAALAQYEAIIAKEVQVTKDKIEVAKRELLDHNIALAKEAEVLPSPTGKFLRGPLSHKGRPFKVRVEFSAPLSTGYADVRDHGFRVSNAVVTGARRIDRRSDLWEIIFAPNTTQSLSIVSTSYLKDKGHRAVVQFSTSVRGVS